MAGLTASLTSAAVKMACDKLGSAIGGQVNLFWNFNNNLEDMKDTLESIAAVLKDAERRSVREESVQLWLKRLKHAAMDISDMLDDSQVAEEAAKSLGRDPAAVAGASLVRQVRTALCPVAIPLIRSLSIMASFSSLPVFEAHPDLDDGSSNKIY